MQKDSIDYWHENMFLTLLKHHPLYRRMYFDPDFYDVSSEDVKAFIFLMCREQVPKQNIMLLREKYRDILANETVGIQGVINRFGLRFPEHDIRTSGSNIYINGYTIRQWELLTSEIAANLNLTVIKRFMNNCVRKGDTSAVEVLTTRYGADLAEEERNRAYKILLEHNLPPDTKYTELDNYHIDGITFNCWRLLHDDEYDPSKEILVSNHRFLKQFCREDDVDFIEDKYHEKLFPSRKEIISEMEIAEANAYFSHFHDKPL